MNPEDIAQRLELLRLEHRDLDAAIDTMTGQINENAPLTIATIKAVAREISRPSAERDHAKLVGALQFEDIDIGEGLPIRLATNCLSLIEDGKVPLAVWVNLCSDYSQSVQLSVEIVDMDRPSYVKERL